jgi:hypothetical protein
VAGLAVLLRAAAEEHGPPSPHMIIDAHVGGLVLPRILCA